MRNAGATLVVLALAWLAVRAQERNLESSAFSTGYVLLAGLFFLAAYNVRKKLPFLPLGSSAAWLQWHLYVGAASVGIFALHVGPAWPNGVLERLLAVVYVLTVASGLSGLYFTRTIPAQLARIGGEYLYERIPSLRHQVGRQADEVVLAAVAESGATTLADFYTSRLLGFFVRPRGAVYFLRPTAARRRALMRQMRDTRRYLSDVELAACERLFSLVRRKDDLDFHEARQKLLKTWLFVHIGLTYALLMAAILHGLLAHAFDGGAV
jgi:hypothetical protein